MRIYLDVCCLNRPFDDQTDPRIHLESEAVLTILKIIEKGEWTLLSSDAIIYEVNRMPDVERKLKVELILSIAKDFVSLDETTISRAKQFQKLGVKIYDVIHLACAEKGKVDVFLTTDDKLLKKAKKIKNEIKIKVENPLEWIKGVI